MRSISLTDRFPKLVHNYRSYVHNEPLILNRISHLARSSKYFLNLRMKIFEILWEWRFVKLTENHKWKIMCVLLLCFTNIHILNYVLSKECAEIRDFSLKEVLSNEDFDNNEDAIKVNWWHWKCHQASGQTYHDFWYALSVHRYMKT